MRTEYEIPKTLLGKLAEPFLVKLNEREADTLVGKPEGPDGDVAGTPDDVCAEGRRAPLPFLRVFYGWRREGRAQASGAWSGGVRTAGEPRRMSSAACTLT